MCGQMEYIWRSYVFLLFWYSCLVIFLHFTNHKTIQVDNKKVSSKQKKPHKNKAEQDGFTESNFILWRLIMLSLWSVK